MRSSGEGVGLAAIARWVGQNEVVRDVAGVHRERDVVIDIGGVKVTGAVEAARSVELAQGFAQRRERLAAGSEHEVLSLIHI